MRKSILASAIALSVLAGCSSTPPESEQASAEIQAKLGLIKLNGTLIRQQDSFVIAPTLSDKKASSSDMLATASWQFSGKTLFPAFKSVRFKCYLSNDECTKYEEIDSPFLKVNGTDSDYGDTYEERVANGKKPGMSAKEAAIKSAAVALVGPAMVLVGTPIALIGGTANLISHGSVWASNWVEFDHDSFYEQTTVAIVAKYGSLENYVDYMVSASAEYSKLALYNERLYIDWKQLKAEKSATLNKYQSIQLSSIEAYKIEMPAYGNIQAASADIHSQIEVYYANSKVNLLSEFDKKFVKAKALYLKNQKVMFDNIETIGDANKFIETYQHNDEAKLVGKARNLVDKAEKRIHKEKMVKRKAALAELESWRKGLSVGDQTFCGRVIDVKYPMFEIAISNPLQGFSDTIWLEKDKVFKPWVGCNNRNNQLTPLTNPLG
ncbi:MAG: hypothetical protein ACTIMZ_09760 [Pseudoalteromonas distincta]|uniref:hypothetical protein n=1 Tax=Pseudoalteromonas distincta TaxID=77608 RepID=UPI003F94A487